MGHCSSARQPRPIRWRLPQGSGGEEAAVDWLARGCPDRSQRPAPSQSSASSQGPAPSRSSARQLWHLGFKGCGPSVEPRPCLLGPVSRVGEGPSASSLSPEVRLGGRVRSAPVCVGGGNCSPLLTLVPGLMILLPFLSPGHRDPLASGHLAPRRHSPESQGTVVKLFPEERSGHWAKKRGLTGDCSPTHLRPSPQVSQPRPCVPGPRAALAGLGRRNSCPPCSSGLSLPSPS